MKGNQLTIRSSVRLVCLTPLRLVKGCHVELRAVGTALRNARESGGYGGAGVIDDILTHGKIRHTVYAKLLQMVFGTDSGQHENLRRVHSAGTICKTR